jgi:single-stranded DNA-binding protein
MFSDTNVVMLMGNLVEDPKLEYFGENETPYCRIGMVSNYRKPNQAESTIQDIVTFGGTATLLVKEGRKGKKVLVVGRLKGVENDVYRNELVVTDLKFVGGPPDRGEDHG